MSSTVSCSSAAQSVSVSSRIPAQIWATPTGWVMNSSPEWRSWSAWRSQAKSKARSTAARSIVASATRRRRRRRRRCRRRRRSRPRASRTPRPRRRGRRGARCALRLFGSFEVSASLLIVGRCRRETPPSAPDRSPLRIRPRRTPRRRRAFPARAELGEDRGSSAPPPRGRAGAAPLPRSASQSSSPLAVAGLAQVAEDGDQTPRWASCRRARASAKRQLGLAPGRVQVAALPAHASRGQPLEVRRRAAGRRGRRARSRARPGTAFELGVVGQRAAPVARASAARRAQRRRRSAEHGGAAARRARRERRRAAEPVAAGDELARSPPPSRRRRPSAGGHSTARRPRGSDRARARPRSGRHHCLLGARAASQPARPPRCG